MNEKIKEAEILAYAKCWETLKLTAVDALMRGRDTKETETAASLLRLLANVEVAVFKTLGRGAKDNDKN